MHRGSMAEELPGTYREADGKRIDFTDALATWIPLAHEKLIATARTYHAYITYRELADHVQQASGIRTRSMLQNWIGRLLEEVATRAKEYDEPPLTSLCVHHDGTIGDGYARAPKSVPDTPTEDIEHYAARHRLLCYRKYAEDLPENGGAPALTKEVSQRRARKANTAPPGPPICPIHHMELSVSGNCDYCD